jgi:drug/metabolite transporter (DMT)-like permease
MQYLILVLVVVAMTVNSIAQKQYDIKAKRQNVFLFIAVFIFVATLFFVASSGFKLNFNSEVLPYSIAFATVYSLSLLTGFMAIKYGPLSITMLVIAYSLIIPTFYGMIFLKEPIGITAYVGIAMIMVSLFLVNFPKKAKSGEGNDENAPKITFKWIIIVVCAFFVNGLNSVVQKEQQMRFDGAYKSEKLIKAYQNKTGEKIVGYDLILYHVCGDCEENQCN